MEFSVTDKIAPQDSKAVVDGLTAYNAPFVGQTAVRPLGVFVRDAAGVPCAGLTGYTHGAWLFIQYLWVGAPLRGQGAGSGLLHAAEAEARRRGCTRAFVDTFAFQAPGFYQKQGYHIAFTLEEHPATGTHSYLVKEL